MRTDQRKGPDMEATKTPLTKKQWIIIAACAVVVVFAVLCLTHVICLGHNWQPATCTEPSYCAKCGRKQGDPLGHTEVIDEAKAPTCTETGLTEGSHCSVCNEVLKAQEEVPALGHTPEADSAKAPTCTETGLTEGSHCSVCGAVLTAQ